VPLALIWIGSPPEGTTGFGDAMARLLSQLRGRALMVRRPSGWRARLVAFAAMDGEMPTLSFATARAFEAWLAKHHGSSKGLWLKLGKKGGPPSVTYQEALDVALCHGWIDGQKKALDEQWWLQKFVPRGPRSIWSRINTGKAEALIAAGKMKPAGLAAIEAARKDGRWAAAYDSPRTSAIPEDFQAALDRSSRAKKMWATLNAANRYAVLFRIQTAKKPETRARRIADLTAMLARGEKLH
jgi:uncharacterized protein YdeI (YjbR/CyaY-like superfamily)